MGHIRDGAIAVGCCLGDVPSCCPVPSAPCTRFARSTIVDKLDADGNDGESFTGRGEYMNYLTYLAYNDRDELVEYPEVNLLYDFDVCRHG